MTTVHFSQKSSRRGSALVLVLFALFLLSAAVIGWAKWLQHDIALSGEANRNVEARAMAHSGVAMALNPAISIESPQLEREFGTQLGYKVTMVGEGGKLNIRWVLEGNGANAARIELFKTWLEHMGLDFQEREAFVDCLLDYTDADDVKRLNGAENEPGYLPPNRPLESIEEIERVRGSEALTNKPGWKESLTLYSNGPIDISSASAEILRALPGIGDARIQQFLIVRAGKDGIDGTADDPKLTSAQMQSYLGVDGSRPNKLSGLITPKDPMMRITSVGHSGNVVRQLDVVAAKGALNPPIKLWQE